MALFNFDPNTISELGLDSLNLPDFVKGNIINYRKANGRFKEVADLRKIYGMNDSIFNVVEKYIIISMPEKKAEKTKNSKRVNDEALY